MADTSSAILGELRKVNEKLLVIQQDISLLATIERANNRDRLLDSINACFGRSAVKRRCFLACDGEAGFGDIARMTGVGESNVRAYLAQMYNDGLLVKREDESGNVVYEQASVTRGIGLEAKIEEFLSGE